MKSDIDKAVRVLNKGGIVIFPTDTAFGIGCRIDNKKSIERLFRIRKRPKNKPTPVLVNSIEMAQKYLLPITDEEVKNNLIKKYWPGALTIILPCKADKVDKLVRGEGNTLGVRMPNHKIALALIREVGIPILGPSANFQGEKTPFRFEELDPKLLKLVDYVMLGETSSLHQSSTVLDCSKKPWKVIREGAIEIPGVSG